MEIAEQRTGEITVIEVKGRIDSNTAKAFGERLAGLLKAGPARLVVDLKHIVYISSAGFRVLLLAARRAHDAGTRLVLCSLTGKVRQLFDLGGFLELFAISTSREEAIAAMHSVRAT